MIQTLVVGSMAANCYILDDIIIDPGDDAEYIMSHIKKPSLIVATHGHFDHIMAAYALTLAFGIPFAMHRDDEFLLANMQKSAKHFLKLSSIDPPPRITRYLSDGDVIGGLTVKHTPGHTPGSICLVGKDFLVTGDTIFAGGAVGRTDFSYSNRQALEKSLQDILAFPKDTRLLPGHGEPTTVGSERSCHEVYS